jgi:hypothetical protein
MTDHETIQQIIVHHAHLRGDLCIDEYAEDFAEDARQTISGAMTSTGRATIVASQATYLPVAHTVKHFPGPSVIDVDGDEARTASDFLYLKLGGDNKIEILTAGRYNDTFERTQSGRWQIKIREINRINDGTPRAGHYPPAGQPSFPFKPA